MAPGRPETVLTNYYGAANLGDAAIALATADALRDRLGRPPSTVESWHPAADAARGLLADAAVFDPLWRPHTPPDPLPGRDREFAERPAVDGHLGERPRALAAALRGEERLHVVREIRPRREERRDARLAPLHRSWLGDRPNTSIDRSGARTVSPARISAR